MGRLENSAISSAPRRIGDDDMKSRERKELRLQKQEPGRKVQVG